ncbi:uncharacterized protein [Pyxicephalus adspersus]|uniref:uncharacterized protein n=1 Tax=Pyxicephalus adspersus TaxID=30357 RepID=UPI003B5C907E
MPNLQMYWHLPILFTTQVAVETLEIQRVHGQYGSDLHLLLSKLCMEKIFDVNQGETQIGNYHDGTLQGFKGFKDRLQFFHHNCTFVIRKFSEADGTIFTFAKYGSVVNENFEITITAASLISKPTVAMSTSVADNGHANTTGKCFSGLFALGFCLDPLIGLIIIFLAMQMKETCRSDKEIASYTQKVVGFIPGQNIRPDFGLSCNIIQGFSLVFQAISLIVLIPCGSLNRTLWVIAAILFVIEVVIASFWMCVGCKVGFWCGFIMM